MKVQKQQATAQAAPSVVTSAPLKKPQPTKADRPMNTPPTEKPNADPKVIHCGGKIYRIHPAAEIFPEMDPLSLAQLIENFKAIGQCESIKEVDGYIVDGRSRLIAANDAGIEPRIETLNIPEDQVADTVVSFNKHRKHLNASQLAMAAARHTTYKKGANQHTPAGVSQGKAAAAMNVSVDGVQRALRVHMNGVPELNAAVDKGIVDVTNAAVIATLPPHKQEEIVAKGPAAIQEAAKAVKNAKHEAQQQEAKLRKKQAIEDLRAKNKPLPVGAGKKYGLIYADVPWDHLGPLGAPYPTMTDQEIQQLPVGAIAEDDAVLFFWATASTLPNALKIITAWGFEFKTSAVWTKGESGMGPYFRTNHEVLMLATRGKPPAVSYGSQPASSFYEDRREHSRKPEKAYEMIQAMYPGLSKLELFCRGTLRQGWDGWGNQCVGAIVMPPQPEASPAANEPHFQDAGDELLTAMGLAGENPAPVLLKRA